MSQMVTIHSYRYSTGREFATFAPLAGYAETGSDRVEIPDGCSVSHGREPGTSGLRAPLELGMDMAAHLEGLGLMPGPAAESVRRFEAENGFGAYEVLALARAGQAGFSIAK